MKRWVYTPSPLLDKTLAERLTTFPRDPTLAVYGLRFLGMLLLKAIFAGYFRLRILGRGRIPKSGPFVLVANHSSHLDAVALACALPVRQWNEDSKGSLELCADLLQVSREALIMFPEGTRSHDGEIREFRNGVGRLVAGTDIPVLPAYIGGAHRAWPKGSAMPRPRRVTIAIGEPRRYAEQPASRMGAAKVAADLRAAVLALRACAPSS